MRLTRGVGECRDGQQTCLADGSGWGPCDGEVTPAAEQCNGLDDNCNGELDDSVIGVGLDCTVGLGECAHSAIAICDPVNGVICPVEAGAPVAEACDGLDNDCDGQLDEDFGVGLSCTNGLGVCRRVGVTRCNAQGVPACAAVPGRSAAETCDQVDNDCDGAVDDGFNLGAGLQRRHGRMPPRGSSGLHRERHRRLRRAPRVRRWPSAATRWTTTAMAPPTTASTWARPACAASGECIEGGTVVCGADARATCSVPGGFGHEEICNGLDDDCDGIADNDVPVGRPCESGRPGICAPGHVLCVDATATCVSDIPAAGEVCDGIDNDCDGTVDNGFGQTSCGVGACRHSIDNCQGGALAQCDPMEGASPELCDGIDNDCDGQIDDAPEDANIPCEAGLGACVRLGRVLCQAGRRSCNAVPAPPTAELCDGIDNDCDGLVDDAALGAGVPCGAGVGACRREAPIVCDQGLLTCPAVAGAPVDPEICNGVDDDCDGLLDEGFGSTVCGLGACRHAVPNCAGGPPPGV